ncbi:TetR/AcrR family transcriptional regulator [Arcobacter peruensis]|uniref:TetR/AcrR family transcriptional regulator n=1 Tax=Arcobacter peruensis TaxID=2320140 RepID=UPI000F080CBF|nr:TetR/AcrR family transcriptional regulator [Arcobacter peruensis]
MNEDKNNLKKIRKNEIMKIASDLFYSKGISETTISEITYLANIGKGTFYEYFKNKDDVINEYIKDYFNNVHNQINEKVDDFKSNREKILFIVKYLFKSKEKDEKFTYVLIEFLRLTFNKKNDEVKKLHGFNEQVLNLINYHLKKGIQTKEFKDCNTEEISIEIISSILGNLVMSLSHEFKDCDNSTKCNVETILNSIKN